MATDGERLTLGNTIADKQDDLRLPGECYPGKDVTGSARGFRMIGVMDVFGGTPSGLTDRQAELTRLCDGGVRQTLGAVASKIETLAAAEFDGRTTKRGSERLVALLAAVAALADAVDVKPPRTTPITTKEMEAVAKLDEEMFGPARRRHPAHRKSPPPRYANGEPLDRFGRVKGTTK